MTQAIHERELLTGEALIEYRANVRDTTACDECSAPVGGACQGRRGDRKQNHRARILAWAKAGRPTA